MIRFSKARQKLLDGRVIVGTFVKFQDPASIEILGACGLDFFVVDNEHIAMNATDLCNIFRAAELSDIAPILRLCENTPMEVLQALDAGALGVQAPNVDTPEQALQLVRSARYAPEGSRGFAPTTRAARYGLLDKFEYVRLSNESVLTVAHCETRTGVDNLDAILAVEGLDVVFIGPMDLSQSYGHIGHPEHPDVREAIARIESKTLAARKALGTVCSPAQMEELVARGYRYLCVGSDHTMVTQAAQSIRAKADSLGLM